MYKKLIVGSLALLTAGSMLTTSVYASEIYGNPVMTA